VVRYEPGDLGAWIDQPCPCGRTAPLFLLKGRHGDVFRIGTNFFNYRVFPELLAQEFGYSGPVQLLLDSNGVREKISMRIETGDDLDPSAVRERLLEKEPNLKESVTETKLLEFEVQIVQAEEFERSASSGKLKEVIERRKV
jgi:phenylacetate-coenzyme A ligase PaaK-like adenylate-forming protein